MKERSTSTSELDIIVLFIRLNRTKCLQLIQIRFAVIDIPSNALSIGTDPVGLCSQTQRLAADPAQILTGFLDREVFFIVNPNWHTLSLLTLSLPSLYTTIALFANSSHSWQKVSMYCLLFSENFCKLIDTIDYFGIVMVDSSIERMLLNTFS